MSQYWNEIQPVDQCRVGINGSIAEMDRKAVMLLYQPLIGTTSSNLYMTMLYLVEENRIWSEDMTHYHLMNIMGLNMREIYESRLKLEGIGLLKTYMKREGTERTFIYELQPPLAPDQFFTDGILNIYLFRKLGSAHFTRMKRFFSDSSFDRGSFNDITRSFQDVFESVKGDALMQDEGQEASRQEEGKVFFSREPGRPVQIDAHPEFDFDLLLTGLSSAMVPRRAFTPAVRSAVEKLSFLYNVNAVDMKNIILTAVTPEQTIEIDELRKAARDWYQMENGDQLPMLVDRIQQMPLRTAGDAPATKEEKLVRYLETTSPRQLLIDIAGGAEPAKADLQAVEDVMFQQQLNPGVVNVLIHYVMLKTDMKLSKNYLEKIASHWARKKVDTVTGAMEMAKNEHRQYQEWASGKKEQQQKRRKPIRTEKLPDWFVEDDGAKAAATGKETEEFEQKRKRMEEIQLKYKMQGGGDSGKNQ